MRISVHNHPHPEAFRQHLWAVLEHGHGRVGHLFNFGLFIVILLSVAVLPLEMVDVLTSYASPLITFEVVVTALFTVEYLLRIYASPRRLRYLFSFFGLIDLLSIAPSYLSLVYADFYKILRLARIIRLLKIVHLRTEEIEVESTELQLLPTEHIEYVVRKHPLSFLLGLVPPLFCLSVGLGVLVLFEFQAVALTVGLSLLLFAAIFLWKAWLDYRFDVVYVTSHRLIFQNRHLLGSTRNQIDYDAITNIKPTYVGLMSYFFGYGSLCIETAAAETGRLECQVVQRYEEAAHVINEKCFSSGRGVSAPPTPRPPE